MHPIPTIAIQAGLIAVPVFLLIVVKARTSSKVALLVVSLLLAVAVGFTAHYLTSTLGWQPAIKSGRSLDLPPLHIFWLHTGGILVVLLIASFSRAHQPGLAPSPPPLRPEASLKSRKTAYWFLVAIYGLALLAWPLLAFIAVFIFGDRRGNPLVNVPMALSIWSYPLLFALGCFWGHFRRNRTVAGVVLKTSVSLLSASWYFLLPGGYAMASQMLARDQPSIAELENRRTALKERFDPVYLAKTGFINSRNPEQDAARAVELGQAAFLPSIPGDDYFPGLESVEQMRELAAGNGRIVAGSEFLSGIEREIAGDPSHNLAEDQYFSPVYKEYLNAKGKYLERFNRAMGRRPPSPQP